MRCGFYFTHYLLSIIFLLGLDTGSGVWTIVVWQWLYAWLLHVWVLSSMASIELQSLSRESTGAMPLPWLYPPHHYQIGSEVKYLYGLNQYHAQGESAVLNNSPDRSLSTYSRSSFRLSNGSNGQPTCLLHGCYLRSTTTNASKRGRMLLMGC